MIRKQVLLDEKTEEIFNVLKERCPFFSDTVILRASILAAYGLSVDDFTSLCQKAYIPVGRVKEKKTDEIDRDSN